LNGFIGAVECEVTTMLFVSAMYDLYPNASQPHLGIAFRLHHLRKLLACDIDIILFADPAIVEQLPPPGPRLHIRKMSLSDITTFSKIMSAGGELQMPSANPEKDVLAYHALINSKIEFLQLAAQMMPGFSEYAWMDGNIFKVFDNDAAASAAIEKLPSFAYPARIVFPSGSRPPLRPKQYPETIYWRFLGGFFIVPAQLLNSLSQRYHEILDDLLRSGRITWEVNVLAMLEAERPELFLAYPADHNITMIGGKLT
jgi:hypothetical protein